ncbi:MAG: hypothetical protein GY771_07535 [bacterium]|nr:hypothetical protein [bacterium]
MEINLLVVEGIYFPYTLFVLEVSEDEYARLMLGHPIYLRFKEGGEIGIRTEIQTLERIYGSRIKMQMYVVNRVRFLNHNGRFLPVDIAEKIGIEYELLNLDNLLITLRKTIDTLANIKGTSAYTLMERFNNYLIIFGRLDDRSNSDGISRQITSLYALASLVIKEPADRLRFINMSFNHGYLYLIERIINLVEGLKIDARVQERVAQRLETQQRDFILHERIKALQKELHSEDYTRLAHARKGAPKK